MALHSLEQALYSYMRCLASCTRLRHVVHTVLPTELTRYGHDGVIIEAVSGLLYSQEAEVVDALLSLFARLLPVAEPYPGQSIAFQHLFLARSLTQHIWC